MGTKKFKSAVVLFIVIVLLFVISVGIVLFLKAKTPEESINESDVVFEGQTHIVSVKSIISVSRKFGKTIEDDNGGSFGYVLFDVVNNSSKDRDYQVYVTQKELSDKEINPGYLMLYLTDEQNQPYGGYTQNILPTFKSLRVMSSKPGSRSLYKGTLKGGERAHFILRAWIADNYVVSSDVETFTFEIDACAVKEEKG